MKSPRSVSSPTVRWWGVILKMASTWLSASCTEGTLYPRTSTAPSPPSRCRRPSSSLTGVPQVSKWASITSRQLLCPAVIWPRRHGQCACWPTPRPSKKRGPGWTTSLTWCMQKGRLFIGKAQTRLSQLIGSPVQSHCLANPPPISYFIPCTFTVLQRGEKIIILL